MDKEQKAIEYFISISKNIEHGSNDYISHCLGVYAILKEMEAPLEICLSGLYHSIYGTEYFSNTPVTSRETIKEIIGEYSEDLVHSFCSLENRNSNLLKNKLNYSERKHKDLCFIEIANLTEQCKAEPSSYLEELIFQYQKILTSSFQKEDTISNYLEVFDNIFETSELDWLNSYCLNANYKCEHSSSILGYERDSRFSCLLDRDNFKSLNLGRVLYKLKDLLGFEYFIGNYYLNHYSHFTSTARHTDSSFDNTFTILIFCNKYWEESWGGELKIYSGEKKYNKIIDFVPGRIVVFDSKIEHKVLPLTMSAKKDRFTLAMKCSNFEGLNALIDMYGSDNIVKFGELND